MSVAPKSRSSTRGAKRPPHRSIEYRVRIRNLIRALDQESRNSINEIKKFLADVKDNIQPDDNSTDVILKQLRDFKEFKNFYLEEIADLANIEGEINFVALDVLMERIIDVVKFKKDETIAAMGRSLKHREIPAITDLQVTVANVSLLENYKKETEAIIDEIAKYNVHLQDRSTKSLIEIRKLEDSFETSTKGYEQEVRQLIQNNASFPTVKQTVDRNIIDLIEKSIDLMNAMEGDNDDE